jgi:hypothetical protein
MKYSEIIDKVNNAKRRFLKGFTRIEIEILLKKIPSVSNQNFFETMGICTVHVIKGEIVFDKRSVINTIIKCIEKNQSLKSWKSK